MNAILTDSAWERAKLLLRCSHLGRSQFAAELRRLVAALPEGEAKLALSARFGLEADDSTRSLSEVNQILVAAGYACRTRQRLAIFIRRALRSLQSRP